VKGIFWALVAVNLAFFGWQLVREPAPEPARTVEAPIPGDVNRLLLLSEVDTGALRERRLTPAPQAPRTPSPPEAAGAGPEAGRTPAAGAEAAPGAPPESLAARAPDDRACYTVGPLEDGERIERLEAWLEAEGGRPELRVDERREVSLYWVYFPPFDTLEAAEARRRALRRAGIEDIYVIPGGDMARAVSLGMYSQRSSLERRLEELEEHGYTPSTMPRYKITRASWLDVTFPGGRDLPVERFEGRFPGVRVSRAACDGAAPPAEVRSRNPHDANRL